MASAHDRIFAALAMAGGALWIFSWACNLQTEDGTRAVLGLSERGWRRLLDPALTLLIVAFFAYRKRYSSPASRLATWGSAIASLGLLTALVGNVIEFWIGELLYADVGGQFELTDHLGFALFLAGVMILVPTGFIILGMGHRRSNMALGWRRMLPLLMGELLAALAVLAMVTHALFGADPLGLVLLVFGVGWMMLGYDLWSGAGRAA